LELKYDRSILGQEYRAGPYQVTKEMIRDFCAAVGETSPLYTDEKAAQAAGHASVIAPPTMCTILVRGVSLPDISLKFGSMRMHAGQVVQPLLPILAGDSLEARSHLKDVYPKTGRSGTMVFIVWETDFVNQRGEVAAEVQESYAVRE
jgi:acyl dehydratase